MNLSYCNSVDDLYSARALLDSLGMAQTKIIAKASGGVGWEAGTQHGQGVLQLRMCMHAPGMQQLWRSD